MHTRSARIGSRTLSIEGLSASDPYFLAVGDGMEDAFANFCSLYLTAGDVCLDIGANIGITAAIMAETASAVHAVEPGQRVYDLLRHNIAANALGNVEPHQLAISDRSGTATFNDNSAYGHIALDGTGHSVPMTTIDALVETLDLRRVDFIKIDVEGFEKGALVGAGKTISAFRPLVYIEFNSWCLIAHSDTNPLHFAQWLADTFPFVAVVSPTSAGHMQRLAADQVPDFLQDNMAHGFVDDLVLSSNPDRFKLPLEPYRRRPRPQTVAELVRTSTLWRAMAPVRHLAAVAKRKLS